MNTPETYNEIKDENLKAWVVFSGQADLPWLKILKKGYRHCYVILNDGKHWICIDPLSNYMDVNVQTVPQDFNLPLWMRNRGHIILSAPIKHLNKQAPWMPFTCVEAVKRVLGIHNGFIFTPWQLYRHLKKSQTESIFKPKGELAWEV